MTQSRKISLLGLAALALLAACGKSDVIRREGEPDVVGVAADDARMNAAMAKARATFPDFLAALQSPKEGQADFAVKLPFTESDGGKEHIWVGKLEYDGTTLKGAVGNDPVDVPGVKLGDPVTVNPAELSDWMYFEDGLIVGGETIRVLRDGMGAEERKQFDAGMKFKE